ncbi:protein turtle-like [Portunus trituberculatus]|uniref:protein turtle-like n=1 Tax=Portunus trituberculatus TaxID=210409 RepID=UPI001E1CB36C|nr:protein turtle-like [Portunus trituberculatus]XP_045120884.1 protein turtle-like [Portunus trituberculatus]
MEGPRGLLLLLLLLVALTLTLSQIPQDPGQVLQVVVVEGGRALLPCDVTAPRPGDSPILVLLYNGVTGMPIYSIDARKGPTALTAHWSGLGERAHFDLTSRPPGLVLQGVREGDAGLYRCRVDFAASPTRNLAVTLSVVVPPESVVIEGREGLEVSGVIGPYHLGEALTLTCHASKGQPRPRVTWWHSGSLLDDLVEEVKGQVTSNTLTLPDLSRQHLHRILICRAASSNLTQPTIASVTLDMTFPPLEVKIEGNLTGLQEGGLHTLSCQATGSRPPANLTWWLNGDLVTSSSTQVLQEGNVSKSTYTFSPGRTQDGAHVTCRAENPVLRASGAVEDTRRLGVYFSPRLDLRVGRRLQLDNIKAGEDVYFECVIQANPRPHRVRWFLEGRELHHNVGAGVIQSNQSLVLQGVTRASTGNYTCSATNTQGTASSPPLHLAVKFAPVCSSGQKWVYGATLSQAVNVSCRVEAFPSPASFKWVFNTSTEFTELSEELITSQGGESVVAYTPLTHHDFGSLLCWASNQVAVQAHPCVFHVVPATVPEPVDNCSAWEGAGAAGRVVVACQPGWSGGLDQTFTLEVREAPRSGDVGPDDTDTNAAGGRLLAALRDQAEPHFTVTGLRPGREYRLAVVAANSEGAAQPTVLVHLTPIDVAEKRTSPVVAEAWPPDHLAMLTPVLGAVAGAMTSLLACSLLLLLLARFRAATRTHAHTSILYMDPAAEGGFTQEQQQQQQQQQQQPEAKADGRRVRPDVTLVRGQGRDEALIVQERKTKEEEKEEEKEEGGGRGGRGGGRGSKEGGEGEREPNKHSPHLNSDLLKQEQQQQQQQPSAAAADPPPQQDCLMSTEKGACSSSASPRSSTASRSPRGSGWAGRYLSDAANRKSLFPWPRRQVKESCV